MSKKSEFINFVEMAIEAYPQEMNDEAKSYWEIFKSSMEEKEKPPLSDNGKMILKCVQEKYADDIFKARDIAEELFVSSRTVSGAMRKLCSDEFCEKVGTDPVIYSITEKGKTFIIE